MEAEFLKRLAVKRAMEKSVWQDMDVRRRIAEEFKQFDIKGEWPMVSELVENGVVCKNPNNVMLYWILGVCEDRPEQPLIYDRSNEFPDIDTDFPPDARDVVKQFARETYGEERVMSIATYGTLGVRSVMHDVCRADGWSREEAEAVTKDMDEAQLIQMTQDFHGLELWEHAKQAFPALAEFCRPPDEARDGDEYATQSVRHKIGLKCGRLLGRIRSMGKHPGGIIIADHDIKEIVPLIKSRDGEVMSSWANGLASKELESFGYVKYDFLGLNNLDYIGKCLDSLSKDGLIERPFFDNGSGWEWSDTSYLNDEPSLRAAAEGKLQAVFQFDSSGIRGLCRELSIDSFDLLAATTAAYRPGPLASGMTDRLIKRKAGFAEEAGWEDRMHPILFEELKETYGVPIYQEQIMRMFHRVGNISLPECEKLRKAIGKKDRKTFASYRDKFIREGKRTLGYDSGQMEQMWDEIEKNAGYLFNKSHAVAYTYISMRCLYLKTHYPAHYFAAACSCLKPGDERIKQYSHAARQDGGEGYPIQLLPPDVNESGIDFKVMMTPSVGLPPESAGRTIRFPLSKVLGVGAVADVIVNEQPFTSLNDFFQRVGTQKGAVESLIKLGALGSISGGLNRKQTFNYFHAYRDVKDSNKIGVTVLNAALKNQGYVARYRNDPIVEDFKKHFGGTKQVKVPEFKEWMDASEVVKEKCDLSRLYEDVIGTIQAKFDGISVPEEHDYGTEEIAAFEQEYLKLYFNHPIENFDRGELPLLVCMADDNLSIEGIVTAVKEKMTKKGNPFYRVTVEDDTGSMEFTVWDNQYQMYHYALRVGNGVRAMFDAKNERFGFNLRKGSDSVQMLERIVTEEMARNMRMAAEENFEAELNKNAIL